MAKSGHFLGSILYYEIKMHLLITTQSKLINEYNHLLTKTYRHRIVKSNSIVRFWHQHHTNNGIFKLSTQLRFQFINQVLQNRSNNLVSKLFKLNRLNVLISLHHTRNLTLVKSVCETAPKSSPFCSGSHDLPLRMKHFR